ncbi:MAG: carboxypeptidase regulatory-like domain-containing protein [Acidobacteriota bacterium]|nr:carboxypeptidase regulatory-like domain-containing protein [Acidobacteriota bacterium]
MKQLISFFYTLVLISTAVAQTDTGSIVGTVQDPTNSPIPNVTVALTNAATGVRRETITNNSGEYQFNALLTGAYTVQVSARGFAPQVRNNIVIDVQSRPSVDFVLKIGDSSQTVEVLADSPLLETQTADVGGVVAQRPIRDLPLNGRRYADLALLEAGIEKNYTNPNNQAPDRFSSNGNLETQNYFSLDGVDNNSGSTNLQEGSVQAVQPPPDAIQEFRVQTRTYSAEFGTSAGAVINATVKSGTNQFHGDVWEFLRNSKLDANSFFNNANGAQRGRFSQNQYGGTFGGPVIRNRTFFFADYQKFTSRKATSTTSTVPTPLMKTGNFTELKQVLTNTGIAGQSGCISGNIIAPGCIDPVGAKLLALFPNPNIPSAIAQLGRPGSFTGSPNYQFQYSLPNDTYSWDTRIDHNLNQNNRIFGRFSDYTVDRQDSPWTSDPIAGNGNFATQYRIRGKSVALALTQSLSSSLLNEVRGGFNRDYAHSDPIGLAVGKSLAGDYGLTGIPSSPNAAGLPPININGLQRLGSSPWRPQFQVSQVWQLLDTLSWLKGEHSFKFGYEYRHTSNNFLDIRSPQGEISANGIYTNNGGFGVPDFLLGDIDSVRFTTPTVVHNYQIGHSFFAQDSWRIKRNLTLNYGVRYELFSPLLNHQNALANFTGADGGGLVTATDGDWYQRSLIHPDKNDFAPRIGFSYQPLDRVVLRGGYGLFYQHSNRIGSEAVLALNPPFVIDAQLSQVLGSGSTIFQLKNGFPASQFTPALVDLTKLQIRAQDPNQRTGYVHQISFGPQFQLDTNDVLDLTYVGNFGHKLQRLRDANQGFVTGFSSSGVPAVAFPYPNLNSGGQHAFLETATNDGTSSYNALLVSLRHRYSRGLLFGISYTWSKNLANFVDNLTGGSTPENAYNYSLERGFSPFDTEHRFVAHASYELPVGRGGYVLNGDGIASRLIGGWQLNSIVTVQTGTPFTVTAPDLSQTGGNHASRANCTGDPYAGITHDPNLYVNGGPGFWLNPAAFSQPAPGTFGNCAPRAFHGPGLQNVDLSLFKNFVFSERARLEFRSEFFNAFNHANFNNPRSSIAASQIGSFGRSFSTVTDPREIQFALKLYF